MKRLLHGKDTEALHPIKYKWAWDHYLDSIKNRWHWNEANFNDDVMHYKSPDRTDEEMRLINFVLGWLANMDNLVLENLLEKISVRLTAVECRLFIAEQIGCEALHSVAYWNANESMGLDHDEINRMWREHPSMVEKSEWAREKIRGVDSGDDRDFLRSIIAFGACVEGLEFISSFVMLLSMRQNNNLFPGIGSTMQWIMRDESLHAKFYCDLAAAVKEENPGLWDAALENECRVMVKEAADMEINYMKDMLNDQGVFNLRRGEMRQYINHLADRRMMQCGITPRGNPTAMPQSMAWIDRVVGRKEENFFEVKVTEYQVSGLDWGE